MDDGTLIKKLCDGDRSVPRFLVEANKNLVWHIIISMVGRNSDSEDLFQEIFLQVFKGIRRYRGDARISTWIGSISHHVCVDYLRKRKKEFELNSNEDDQMQIINLTEDMSWRKTERSD
ncbi:MAG: sigma-70 family RNA polymerase sigma factor, partial [Alphaproteobacteria bacterium]